MLKITVRSRFGGAKIYKIWETLFKKIKANDEDKIKYKYLFIRGKEMTRIIHVKR